MSLERCLEKIKPEIDEVNEWAEAQYNEYFAPYFKGTFDLHKRIKSSKDPITDTELEHILTDTPLDLLAATEQLSKLKTAQEVIKLHIKQQEREYIKAAEGSETKKKEEAAALTSEDRLLVSVYDTIVERVSRQMTFSKELIMSAKKIWDARRADGIPLPDVVTPNDTLPEYDFNRN